MTIRIPWIVFAQMAAVLAVFCIASFINNPIPPWALGAAIGFLGVYISGYADGRARRRKEPAPPPLQKGPGRCPMTEKKPEELTFEELTAHLPGRQPGTMKCRGHA